MSDEELPDYIITRRLIIQADRLFLAYYTHPPTEQTPFPWPLPEPVVPRPGARASQITASSAPEISSNLGPGGQPPIYLTVDDDLRYNAFHHDFGPLHIGNVYRFAALLHDVMVDEGNSRRAVVFWSKPDPKSEPSLNEDLRGLSVLTQTLFSDRANAACLLAVYMIIMQDWPAHLALAPIAQADPPFMPFRDAGYSQADYGISIQDVVYGIWRALHEKVFTLENFDIDEYELHERIEYGDFNWITPDFLAFASPQLKPAAVVHPSDPRYAALPKSINQVIDCAAIPNPFKWVLTHFAHRNVGLVVRLNSELYSPSYFTALGINHIDMIFPDGTCPQLSLVRRFVNLAHRTIADKKAIAVHCKAGLGRTGCLIGAYLIYRHGFAANEVIGFMRLMRPGMVVGPQQHWLYLNQGRFREWWFEDSVKAKLAAIQASKPQVASVTTQPKTPVRSSRGQNHQATASSTAMAQNTRPVLAQVDGNGSPSASPSFSASAMALDEDPTLNALPAPTPGQPRKSHRKPSSSAQNLSNATTTTSTTYIHEDADPSATNASAPATEIIGASYHGRRTATEPESGDEEWALQLLAKRRSSRSPRQQQLQNGSRRAVTCSEASNGARSWLSTSFSGGGGNDSDVENQIRAESGEAVLRSEKIAGAGARKVGSPRANAVQQQQQQQHGGSGSGSRSGSGIGSIVGVVKVRRESPRRAVGAGPEGVRKASQRLVSGGMSGLAEGLRRIS